MWLRQCDLSPCIHPEWSMAPVVSLLCFVQTNAFVWLSLACLFFSTARKLLFCCNHLGIADIAVRSKLEGNDNGCPLKNTQCCVFHISVLSGSGFAVHLMRKVLGPLQPVHLSLCLDASPQFSEGTVHLSSRCKLTIIQCTLVQLIC